MRREFLARQLQRAGIALTRAKSALERARHEFAMADKALRDFDQLELDFRDNTKKQGQDNA